jgi:hypothetical protein
MRSGRIGRPAEKCATVARCRSDNNTVTVTDGRMTHTPFDDAEWPLLHALAWIATLSRDVVNDVAQAPRKSTTISIASRAALRGIKCDPMDAEEQLVKAAAAKKLTAKGQKSGKDGEIPTQDWRHARVDESKDDLEPVHIEVSKGPKTTPTIWRAVTFKRDEILALWREKRTDPAPFIPPVPVEPLSEPEPSPIATAPTEAPEMKSRKARSKSVEKDARLRAKINAVLAAARASGYPPTAANFAGPLAKEVFRNRKNNGIEFSEETIRQILKGRYPAQQRRGIAAYFT